MGVVPPGSVARRKSLRFVSDEMMEQVRIIPPHNGEPELCGRIAPDNAANIIADSAGRTPRRRTPNPKYASDTKSATSPAGSELDEEECEGMRDVVNTLGDVGHTGPIPKFTAPNAAGGSPKSTSSRKRITVASSPCSTGGSKRAAVSFAIGQCEVTDDVAGTPIERKSGGSSFTKRKGTPAPALRTLDDEDDSEEEEDEDLDAMPIDSAEANAAVPLDVTVVEEGVLGSGRTDLSAGDFDISVAGTDEADDTGDDIPVFRLGDVGNTVRTLGTWGKGRGARDLPLD